MEAIELAMAIAQAAPAAAALLQRSLDTMDAGTREKALAALAAGRAAYAVDFDAADAALAREAGED